MVPDAAWNKGWCQCQNCHVGVKMEAFQANTRLKTSVNHIYHPTLRTIVSQSHIVNVNSWDSAKWRKPRTNRLELCNSSVMFWECGLDMPGHHRHFAIFAADGYSLVGINMTQIYKHHSDAMISRGTTIAVAYSSSAFRLSVSHGIFHRYGDAALSCAVFGGNTWDWWPSGMNRAWCWLPLVRDSF